MRRYRPRRRRTPPKPLEKLQSSTLRRRLASIREALAEIPVAAEQHRADFEKAEREKPERERLWRDAREQWSRDSAKLRQQIDHHNAALRENFGIEARCNFETRELTFAQVQNAPGLLRRLLAGASGLSSDKRRSDRLEETKLRVRAIMEAIPRMPMLFSPIPDYPPVVRLGYRASDEGLALARKDEANLVEALTIAEERENRVRRRYGADDATIAAAAAHLGHTRALAKRIRIQLRDQAALSPECPYCGDKLGDNVHQDHIVPVKHGGLSDPSNMVLVCARCNLAKGEQTLREYLRDRNLNRERTEAILEQLGKRF